MTANHRPQPPTGPASPPAAPFLSLRSAVVLLTATVIGLIIGGLTVLTSAPIAAAVIAGLTSTGASIPVLRTLIE
ncbi:hypothetical protein [Streptomyces sp. NPDC059378]|uniref:hypothetical protein n=1 Tax=Streptomyces sp. NPDC059378 TaxID=3346815 RepID=UPI0036CB0B4D